MSVATEHVLAQLICFSSTAESTSYIQRIKQLIPVTAWVDLERMVLSEKKKKKPISKGDTLHDLIYITFLK